MKASARYHHQHAHSQAHRDLQIEQRLRPGGGRHLRRAALALATSVVAALALGWMPLPAQAETLETNNPDIVVKRVYCVDYGLGGVLVNKSGKPFRGSLAVAVKDEEGDVVGRGTQRLRVGATNGARFAYYYINTLDCRKHSFDFTVN
jgi:hypothetical protein